jgi:protein-S-isoprenylcysteine O-methyltransferase Ste14
MNTSPETPQTERHPNAVATILQVAQGAVILPVITAAVAFIAAGRLDWTWAWVYLAMNLATALVVTPIAIHTNPVTVAAHEEPTKAQRWDVGSLLVVLGLYIALPLVAGLDERFGWAPDISIAWHVAGGVVLAVGLALPSWVMTVNPFIWSDVTIQSGQMVCTAGPYQIVRHPAYTGLILQALGIPILLGSLWALVPGIVAAAFIIAATIREDRTLQAELAGYREYAERVRFRLVPGVW